MEKITLTTDELNTAVIHERLILEAQTVLNERVQAQNLYIAHLRRTHQAPESQYDLLDWFQGFTPKATAQE